MLSGSYMPKTGRLTMLIVAEPLFVVAVLSSFERSNSLPATL